MQFSILLLVYGFTFLFSLAFLRVLVSFSAIENIFFRVLTGGTVGTFTSSYLIGLTPFLSFLEASITGEFGLGGFFCIAGLFTMLGVWSFNLFTTRETIVL